MTNYQEARVKLITAQIKTLNPPHKTRQKQY